MSWYNDFMRKVLSFPVIILLSVCLFVFFVLLNLQLTLLQPAKVKSLASETNIYALLANTIKESMVKGGVDVKNGEAFEVLNEAITSSSLKGIGEDVIDQFFSIVDDPSKPRKIVVNYAPVQQKLKQVAITKLPAGTDPKVIQSLEYPKTSDTLDLENGLVVPILSNFPILVWGFLGLAVFFLLLVLFLAGNWGERIGRTGISLLLSALALGVAAFAIVSLPSYFGSQISSALNLLDPKVAKGILNAISSLLSTQKLYLGIEAGALFLVSLALIFVAKSTKKISLGEMEDKI